MCCKFTNHNGCCCRIACSKYIKVIYATIFWFLFFNTYDILRKLLSFGKISWYLGYNALVDFFPSMMIKPNPNCTDNFCMKRQEEFNNRVIEEPVCSNEELPEDKVIHKDNEWG